jgi:cell division protein FtsI/penicillin-binding protein 2
MKWRYRFSLFLFIILFLMIDVRLYYWQIVRADELSGIGQAQYGTEVKLIPQRGQIMTKDGFTIAANKISYLVFANPKVIKDKETAANMLSPLLKIESSTISAQLNRDSFYSPLKTQVDESVKEKIESLNIAGINFNEQTTRFYPEASMAAKILGFVGKDQKGAPIGSYGLEGYYERELRGKTGIAVQIRDAWGNPIPAKLNDSANAVDGRSLTLNIDRIIQYILEQELKNGIEKYGAESGYAGIIDPKTGAILAMSAFPTYDPQHYQDFKDNLYNNPFISATYEPGSTFKSLIMSSAIDAGVINSDTICTICEGPVEIGGYSIKTWNNKYYPNITMTEVIQHSDNTGMVFVGQKLGLDRMISYLNKFGIGDLTGIDLQGEVSPDLRKKNDWHPIDLATATFGQGITVTPIQLLTAFASIANDGKRMEPHIVNTINTPDGNEIKIQPKVLSKPISPKTAKIMTEILVNAVDNGEAKWAKPKGYRIAGKTGTAQIAVAGHYDPKQTIASFIGFAPAEDPKFAMLVVLNRPTSSIYGAETAAPIFFNIAKKILTYYNIPPDTNIND